jgi:DNA-3-methyladenine glycosylase I
MVDLDRAQATEIIRCGWAANDRNIQYHDTEWGVPVHDDRKQFEFLLLEGAQAGLSWDTILQRREGYRRAFDDFDIEKVASYGADKVALLLGDSGIIRNRLKVAAAVTNARAFVTIREQYGSFDAYIWRFVDGRPRVNAWTSLDQLPASSVESEAMSKDLKQRGFKFVGSTICYAHMQATGMVNDHLVDCFRYRDLVAHRPA